MQGSHGRTISRRNVLKLCLTPLAAIACSNDGAAGRATDPAETDGGLDANAVPWATGGTRSMHGNYPDPFAGAAGTMCALTSAMMLGPCYTSTVEREDISDGELGLPVRLSFLVVRADGCTPIAGATVDIWHTGPQGVYSGIASKTICNPGDMASANRNYCRGARTTDANGRVDFSTVFPGWYSGRAVHIHFTLRIDGNEYVTSQLFFDDALNDEILTQGDYGTRGSRDTRNEADMILPKDNAAPFLFSTAKRSDGSLHAWKVLAVRSSLDETLPFVGPDITFPVNPPISSDGGVAS